MIALTPLDDGFVLAFDEPGSVEVHVVNGVLVAHAYNSSTPDENTDPIGGFDGNETNVGWTEPPGALITCSTCGRSWDDSISTDVTPVPAGRCPYEYEHEQDEEES